MYNGQCPTDNVECGNVYSIPDRNRPLYVVHPTLLNWCYDQTIDNPRGKHGAFRR